MVKINSVPGKIASQFSWIPQAISNFEHVKRGGNQMADCLANNAISSQSDQFMMLTSHTLIKEGKWNESLVCLLTPRVSLLPLP